VEEWKSKERRGREEWRREGRDSHPEISDDDITIRISSPVEYVLWSIISVSVVSLTVTVVFDF
jgi:hypothetical protein